MAILWYLGLEIKTLYTYYSTPFFWSVVLTVVNSYFGVTSFSIFVYFAGENTPCYMSMSDSMFHGPTKINQNIQNAPGGRRRCSAKLVLRSKRHKREMAQTPIWQRRECAQVIEREQARGRDWCAASRTSPLRIRTSSSAGYPITAGDSRAPILCIFIAHSRSQTDAHFVSNEYISSTAALALIPSAIAAMQYVVSFYAKSRGLSGAADRGGALEKGRAHAPAAFE